MKAVKFKESNLYSLSIYRGSYLIDGKPVIVESYNTKVQVLNINDVRPVSRTEIIDHYISDQETINISDYNEKKALLLTNRKETEDDSFIWDSLESEFEYRKFISKHKAIKKNIEVVGDPFSIEIIESQIESGCDFINSDYINGGKDPLLFIYNRKYAVLNIVKDKFNELKMDFVQDAGYANTNNKKIWTNSTHSVIRYVAAFNKYIFNDSWDIKSNPRGELNRLVSMYKSDKETLENIIDTKYKEHFGYIDSGDFNFKALLDMMNHSKNMFNKITPHKKSHDLFRSAFKKLNDSIEFIENSYKIK